MKCSGEVSGYNGPTAFQKGLVIRALHWKVRKRQVQNPSGKEVVPRPWVSHTEA